ncbi:MAG: sigma-70 family RNA polymerase sigma factor [Planctomycetaceae bacterium]|nr:sigma-70 family RNA polymerase sigma factor [Planctomycetaceae bacterium]
MSHQQTHTLTDGEADILLHQAQGGDEAAWNRLFSENREQLRKMVQLRLNPHLHKRLDASDIIQEAQLQMWTDLPSYLENPKIPFRLWMRLQVNLHLVQLHRRHLQTQQRDAQREIRLNDYCSPSSDIFTLASLIAENQESPSEHAMRIERADSIRVALEDMDPIDREILVLRHFEHLSRSDTAQLLGITPLAAGKRYFRAIKRLKTALTDQLAITPSPRQIDGDSPASASTIDHP